MDRNPSTALPPLCISQPDSAHRGRITLDSSGPCLLSRLS
jgi:hypothetical protein